MASVNTWHSVKDPILFPQVIMRAALMFCQPFKTKTEFHTISQTGFNTIKYKYALYIVLDSKEKIKPSHYWKLSTLFQTGLRGFWGGFFLLFSPQYLGNTGIN